MTIGMGENPNPHRGGASNRPESLRQKRRGIPVGTHAFLAMANALGVTWGDLSRTQDADFAHAGNRVELALPANLEIAANGRVIEHAGLGVPLQPLRFLEFLLEDIQQAVVLSSLGATLVNLPDPVRFALHKLGMG
ncbi:MAG TPA: GSU2403 family nucleotidyltransferase fold protein [Usitatibacter sp.]|nr:GSU2403 family nucleotidyltransferase fold protein [Usitatibacter sp.]